MKTKNEILHLLSLYKPTAQSKYGLTRLGIFGSVARDEHTEGSDVDVCYEVYKIDLVYLVACREFSCLASRLCDLLVIIARDLSADRLGEAA